MRKHCSFLCLLIFSLHHDTGAQGLDQVTHARHNGSRGLVFSGQLFLCLFQKKIVNYDPVKSNINNYFLPCAVPAPGVAPWRTPPQQAAAAVCPPASPAPAPCPPARPRAWPMPLPCSTRWSQIASCCRSMPGIGPNRIAGEGACVGAANTASNKEVLACHLAQQDGLIA